MKFGEQGGCF